MRRTLKVIYIYCMYYYKLSLVLSLPIVPNIDGLSIATMTSTADPLNSLKQAIRSKAKITYKNDSGSCSTLSSATHLVFSPSLSLPKSTPTRLRKATASSTDPQAHPSDFFPLDAVYLAWLLKDASGAEYMKQARENGLLAGFVSVTERKGVVDWLENRTAHHDRIVPLQCELYHLILFNNHNVQCAQRIPQHRQAHLHRKVLHCLRHLDKQALRQALLRSAVTSSIQQMLMLSRRSS